MIAALVGVVWLDLCYSGLPLPTDAPFWTQWLSRGGVLSLMVGVVSALAAAEFCRLLETSGHRPIFLPTLVYCFLITLAPAWPTEYRLTQGGVVPLLILAAAVFNLFIAAGLTRRTAGAIDRLSVSALTVCYIGGLLSFAVQIRVEYGSLVLLTLIAIIKSADIGAYTFGRIFGKHKMIPWLSPGKTWEGLLGGIVFSTVIALLAPLLLQLIHAPHPGWSWQLALLLGPAMAVVGQVGDLSESLLKRDANTKDSGATVPGFGGLLDVIDSPLFALPVSWAILRFA